MAKPHDEPSAQIQLIPATPEQEPILANLLELYLHDFSEFLDIALEADGRFHYANLPLYWSQQDRYPFLVEVNGKWAGLVLVKRGSEITGDVPAWDMAEFFVTRRCRRRGVGTQIAHQVWKRFPGPWEVRVMQSNVPAYNFWSRTIGSFTRQPIQPVHIEKNGTFWNLFSFEPK